jgi:hypothetical protein
LPPPGCSRADSRALQQIQQVLIIEGRALNHTPDQLRVPPRRARLKFFALLALHPADRPRLPGGTASRAIVMETAELRFLSSVSLRAQFARAAKRRPIGYCFAPVPGTRDAVHEKRSVRLCRSLE